MIDEIDAAAINIDALTDDAIKRKKSVPMIAPRGSCYWCNKPLTDANRRWCDSYCRDTWEEENL